ncbi:MAG TPA: type II toxin-antitoxin system RelE/ParE family toxin [Candidatus Sabulitectum sp.]|nr:type II toxin-antitoxin system RelE/ParE family toxin [Candidatus Sabulitectum sp.]HPJ29304.1 type II toxin-antitoxin system RelE/ParE family toxin [Candidatus Sabulitectum sp.]HPR22268.1 type II toxin-antitoxin system RelE/ParE family toxin [Candidatus Sabulitectum sp.]
MAYRITFKSSVSRDLKKLDRSDAERVLKHNTEELPHIADSLPELKGKFAGFRKYRFGDYRVVFTILDDSILITRVRHRREAYNH